MLLTKTATKKFALLIHCFVKNNNSEIIKVSKICQKNGK